MSAACNICPGGGFASLHHQPKDGMKICIIFSDFSGALDEIGGRYLAGTALLLETKRPVVESPFFTQIYSFFALS